MPPPVARDADPVEAGSDRYADITQATVPSGLALIPGRLLKALHLA